MAAELPKELGSEGTWIRRALLRLPYGRSGLLGEGLRFGAAGLVVAAVYMTVTTVLADVFGLRFQLALALGFSTAIGVHFTLQRTFVWAHRETYALPFRAQFTRYALMSGAQYGTAVLATSFLPSALGLSTTLVYVGWTLCGSGLSFLILGRGIFHAGS
jgi:putative flippase GtrA